MARHMVCWQLGISHHKMREDDSTKEIDTLRMKIDDLEEENENLRNKIDDFYKRSAHMMEKSGSQENTNDELSNTRLADRFDVALKEQWLQLCETLANTFNEIQYLTHLSEVMQSVFKHCTQKVEETEKHLLQIAKYANADHKKVRLNLRVLRKPLGQKQSTRHCVVQDIVAKAKEDDRVNDLLTEHTLPDVTIKTIATFMNDLADICWLMCIANPPLKLNFDLKGVDFKSVSDRFVEFASTGDVKYSDGKPGAVYLVAWPSVEHEDNSGFLKKGEVIVC
ncbi:uncharacterized protein LOC127860472 isoform X2 [Dreissena polymorpha]|uniref:uncharacterized protein LOC127860472 isoform X2 n=1 Tax=Dreissena polymorpha TaxID=45954 RepID=UPI0022644396|nr:uncharacterized protein LOC127860472 isoform X2 [Dreissena polymorpha]XP_052254564.1 uncharacterized protein LOC127860472 isoform X2 [Dreissena polymorpha]